MKKLWPIWPLMTMEKSPLQRMTIIDYWWPVIDEMQLMCNWLLLLWYYWKKWRWRLRCVTRKLADDLPIIIESQYYYQCQCIEQWQPSYWNGYIEIGSWYWPLCGLHWQTVVWWYIILIEKTLMTSDHYCYCVLLIIGIIGWLLFWEAPGWPSWRQCPIWLLRQWQMTSQDIGHVY